MIDTNNAFRNISWPIILNHNEQNLMVNCELYVQPHVCICILTKVSPSSSTFLEFSAFFICSLNILLESRILYVLSPKSDIKINKQFFDIFALNSDHRWGYMPLKTSLQ